MDADGMRDADEVLAEINGHGCTVVRIKKGRRQLGHRR